MATHTLLVADDSHTVRRIVEMACAGDEFDVVAVADGEGAIAEISERPPDIVLADIEMPGRNGYEVAAFVKGRADLAHIPVLLMAGMYEATDEARASAIGCAEVLIKPLRPQVVVERMRHWLDAVDALTSGALTSDAVSSDAATLDAAGTAAPGEEAIVPPANSAEALPTLVELDGAASDADALVVFAPPSEEAHESALEDFAPDAGTDVVNDSAAGEPASPSEDYFSRLDAAFKTLARPVGGAPVHSPADQPGAGAGEPVPTLQELLHRLPHETRTRLTEDAQGHADLGETRRSTDELEARTAGLVDAIAARVLQQLIDREDVLDAIARRLAVRQSSGDHR